MDKTIRFIQDGVRDNSSAFLECVVDMEADRRPTHTDKYLPFQPHHPPEQKLDVIRTLQRRAQTVPTKGHKRKNEVLRTCGYPDWAPILRLEVSSLCNASKPLMDWAVTWWKHPQNTLSLVSSVQTQVMNVFPSAHSHKHTVTLSECQNTHASLCGQLSRRRLISGLSLWCLCFRLCLCWQQPHYEASPSFQPSL